MSEENKALMRRFYEEVFNRGNLAILDELCASNFVDHNPFPGQAPGIEGVKQSFTAMRAAFPDMRVTVEDMLAEGDKVATHISFHATHRGEFMGMAPSGNEASARISDILRFASGKAVERWAVEDMSGLFQAPGS
jgi:predicted ester cyclase